MALIQLPDRGCEGITGCGVEGIKKLCWSGCLNCLSDTKLDQMWLLLWMIFSSTSDLEALLTNSACLTCLSEKDIKKAKIALFADFLTLDSSDVAEISALVGCLQCWKPKQVQAATLYLICRFLDVMESAELV